MYVLLGLAKAGISNINRVFFYKVGKHILVINHAGCLFDVHGEVR